MESTELSGLALLAYNALKGTGDTCPRRRRQRALNRLITEQGTFRTPAQLRAFDELEERAEFAGRELVREAEAGPTKRS